MARNTRIGQRVKILGGMPEFLGCTGRIIGQEMGLYRVRLDETVYVPGCGFVDDDLWESKLLRTQTETKSRRKPRAAFFG